MQHPVLSEQEMSSAPRKELVPGKAKFRVIRAEEKISKSGNQMVELKHLVTDVNQTEGEIYDYLVATPNAAFKIRHFWKACGKGSQYETGQTPAELCLNQTGECMIKLEKSRDPAYPPRIVIVDYVPREETNDKNDKNEIIDDDLPF